MPTGGTVGVCVWGAKEECESVAHTISAMMALPPPPPPPAPRPPLSTPRVLEGLLGEAGLSVKAQGGVDRPFVFADATTAWRCFSSSGLAVLAIRQVGEEPIRRATLASFGPFTRADGTVAQKNRFHWVLATRSSV